MQKDREDVQTKDTSKKKGFFIKTTIITILILLIIALLTKCNGGIGESNASLENFYVNKESKELVLEGKVSLRGLDKYDGDIEYVLLLKDQENDIEFRIPGSKSILDKIGDFYSFKFILNSKELQELVLGNKYKLFIEVTYGDTKEELKLTINKNYFFKDNEIIETLGDGDFSYIIIKDKDNGLSLIKEESKNVSLGNNGETTKKDSENQEGTNVKDDGKSPNGTETGTNTSNGSNSAGSNSNGSNSDGGTSNDGDSNEEESDVENPSEPEKVTGITVDDIVFLNEKDDETLYFSKGEDIKMIITVTNPTGVTINTFTVNGKTFSAKKVTSTSNNGDGKEKYIVILPGKLESKIESISLSSLTLVNGKISDLNEVRAIEILKDIPLVEDFIYTYNEGTGLEDISLYLKDNDNSLIKNKVFAVLFDEDGVEVDRKLLSSGNNDISLKVELGKTYTFKVIADYDLDFNSLNDITGQQNLYTNEVLFEQEIFIDKKLIEFKDLTGVQVYKKEGSNVVPIDIIDVSVPLNLADYYMELTFMDMPTVNVPIKSYEVINSALQLVADVKEIVQYDNEGNANQEFRVNYTSTNSGNIDIQTIQGLKQAITQNPSGTFNLTKDLDASINTEGEAIIPINFKGTLNGNGYKIKNSKIPLFRVVDGGTVNGLIFENSSFMVSSLEDAGILAKVGISATVKNVHIENANITGRRNIGGIFGKDTGSNISECSAKIHISISGGNVGALVGYKNGGQIANSYAIGSISTEIGGAGEKVGGLIGQLPSGTLTNSYSAVNITSKNETGTQVGGLLGSTYGSGNGVNNISFGDVINGMKLDGDRNFLGRHKNSYEYEGSEGTSVTELTNPPSNILVATETQKNDTNFYTNTLGWNASSVWDLSKVSTGEYPALKNFDSRSELSEKAISKAKYAVSGILSEARVDDGNGYIPYIERISSMDTFDNSKRIAYSNIYKLMPYYESKYIVEYGNKIPASHELNKKLIDTILPIGNGNLQTSITTENYSSINEIIIKFKDDSISKYSVTGAMLKTNNAIAEYEVSGLGIIYNPNSYVTKSNEAVINELVNSIKAMTFDDVLSVVGGRYIENGKVELNINGAWQRFDLDFYLLDESYSKLQGNAKGYITSLMSSLDNLNVTSNNSVISLKVKNDITNKLKLYLFSNTYISRWYDVKLNSVNLKDLIYFYPEVYNNNLTSTSIVNNFTTFSETNREALKTNQTNKFYREYLSSLLGHSDAAKLIEESVKIFNGVSDTSKWFKNYFDGYIAERSIESMPNAEYTAWQGLKSNKQNNFVLPAVTYKGGEMYIVSTPGTIAFGSLTTYNQYYEEGKGPEFVKGYVDRYADRLKAYYSTLYRVNNRTEELINNNKHVVWDTMSTKNGVSGWADVRDPKYTTMHYFYAANRIVYSGNSGAAGVANGYWSWYPHVKVLDSDYAYSVWTHENAHNQDGSLIMDGFGRRIGLGAEDYATGVFEHGATGDSISINFGIEYSNSDVVYANRSPQRFQNEEDFNDFYKGLMNTVYVMDIIEAEVLLEMDAHQQSKFIKQLNYGKPGEAVDKSITRNDTLTTQQVIDMNLTTIDDLVDNRIVTRMPEGPIYPNNYGATHISHGIFYQAYNENGRTDNSTEKRFAFDIFGDKGWQDGFIEYFSNKRGYKTDIEALRGVYNDPTLTVEQWKKNRFAQVSNELNTGGLSVVSKEVIKEMFKKAFEQDYRNGNGNAMSNARRQVYLMIKEGTQEFRTSIFGSNNESAISISSAQEFVDKISENPNAQYYLTNDLDFTGITPKGEASYITEVFKGILKGNGHKITGTSLPIFGEIKNSFIDSFAIVNANIDLSEVSSVGALARDTYNVYIENVHIINSTIKGDERVGGLVGFDRDNGTIVKSSFNGVIEAKRSFAGGLVGAKYFGSVESSYSAGIVIGGSRYIGGLIGDNRSSIKNSYSSADVKGGGLVGSFVGVTEHESSGVLENNLVLGNTNRYIFVEQAITSKLVNNYQYENSNGISNIDKEGYSGRLKNATKEDIFSPSFYSDVLGWDIVNVWDVSKLSIGELPTLRSNLDDSNKIILEEQINSAKEFVDKISKNPLGNYKLMTNIDLSAYNLGEAVIDMEFTGDLNGNGKTITGLSIPMFKVIRGSKIFSLVIDSANINMPESDDVAVLGKQTYKMNIDNVHITNANIIGNERVGGLSAFDREGSVITNSSVNGSIEAKGSFVGLLIGAMYNGQVESSYTRGTVIGKSRYVGGLIGDSRAVIRNSYSSANVTGGGQSGSFIGVAEHVDAGPIENNLALGNSSRYLFVENNVADKFNNNYVYDNAEGNNTHTTKDEYNGRISNVTEAMLKDPSFYSNVLHWDTVNTWDVSKVSIGELPTLKTTLDDANSGQVMTLNINDDEKSDEDEIKDEVSEEASNDELIDTSDDDDEVVDKVVDEVVDETIDSEASDSNKPEDNENEESDILPDDELDNDEGELIEDKPSNDNLQEDGNAEEDYESLLEEEKNQDNVEI